jgi:outer membrane protein TolC
MGFIKEEQVRSRRKGITRFSGRMNRLLVGWTIVILMVVISRDPVFSQPLKITEQDAVHLTLKNNYDLTSARLEVERSDALVREAWGNAFPKLDVDASYTRALKKPVFYLPGDFFGAPGTVRPVEIGSTNALLGTLRADQVLFNSTVFVGVGAAKIYSRGAREVYRAKRLDFITAARRAYYGVLVTRQFLDLAVETEKNVNENLRTVRLLAGQGLVSEYDQLRAEVTLENVKPEVINAENAYRIAINNLKTVMAIPYDQQVEVEGTMEFVPVSDTLVSRATEIVLTKNPTIASLKYQVEFNDAVTSAYRSEYLPRLSAFGNLQYQAQSNVFDQLTDNIISSSQVGLSLSMNIFNGFQTTARVQQAQIEHQKAAETLSGTTQTLQTATESVLLELNKAKRQVEAQGRTVEQAERGYRIATTRYQSGLGTQLEVNDAQLALVRANVNRIQAVFDYIVAAAELDRLLGIFPSYVNEPESEE